MSDIPSHMADRRCPDCAAVQPLYVAGSGSKGLQRGGAEVVPCPGCGAPLRLSAQPGDPGGIKAAVVMVVGLTALIVGVVMVASAKDLAEATVAGLLVVLVFGGIALGVIWNAKAARKRRVIVVAREDTE